MFRNGLCGKRINKEEWLDVHLYLIRFAVHLKLIHCQSSLLQ